MSWLASYHYIFVHFPIALTVMLGIAELIRSFRKEWLHESIPNFLLAASLLFLIPTIGTGLLLEEVAGGGASNHDILEWHESFAFAALGLGIATVCFRYWAGRGTLYLLSLVLWVLAVGLAAHFGGLMAFGPMSYLPSF